MRAAYFRDDATQCGEEALWWLNNTDLEPPWGRGTHQTLIWSLKHGNMNELQKNTWWCSAWKHNIPDSGGLKIKTITFFCRLKNSFLHEKVNIKAETSLHGCSGWHFPMISTSLWTYSLQTATVTRFWPAGQSSQDDWFWMLSSDDTSAESAGLQLQQRDGHFNETSSSHYSHEENAKALGAVASEGKRHLELHSDSFCCAESRRRLFAHFMSGAQRRHRPSSNRLRGERFYFCLF